MKLYGHTFKQWLLETFPEEEKAFRICCWVLGSILTLWLVKVLVVILL